MKDYANRSFNYSEAQQQEKAPIHWGIIIAALVAMVVIYSAWHHRRQAQPVAPQPQVLSSHPATKAPLANVAPAVTSTKTLAIAPAPAKVMSPPVKFDFYQMLTEGPSSKNNRAATNSESADNHTNVTHSVASTSAPPSSTSANDQNVSANTNTAEDVRYYIQAGNYRTKADALQQKANLILGEISPKLIKVTGSNGHYRVVVGPYSKLASATAARSDLKQNGINSSLIKDNNLKK